MVQSVSVLLFMRTAAVTKPVCLFTNIYYELLYCFLLLLAKFQRTD